MQTVSFEVLKDTLYYQDIPVLNYTIQYPVFTSDCSQEAARAINGHYASLAKTKEAYCKTVLYPQAVESARYIQSNFPPFHSYEYDVTCQITYNSACITSLYMDEYTFMGGAHGSTVRSSDTWDFSSGKRMELKDFYPHAPSFINEIQQWIEKRISDDLNAMPSAYFDDYAVLLRRNFHPESYFLVPGSLVIYYQQYDIAPYSSGIPEFPIPFQSNGRQ